MGDFRKDITTSGRQAATRETQQQQQPSTWEHEEEEEEVRGQSEHVPVRESGNAAEEELRAPPSFELATKVALTMAPDGPPVFGWTGEPRWPQPADTRQLSGQTPQPRPVEPPSPPPEPQPVYNNEDVMSVLDCVVEEVVEAEVRAVARLCAYYPTAALVENSVRVESLLSDVSAEIKLDQECLIFP